MEKTRDQGGSPWFSICTIDKKGTPQVILPRSRHSENHARKGVVFCFWKSETKFWILEKTRDQGGSPWFSICTIDKKGTPQVILPRSRHSENHARKSVVFCFWKKRNRTDQGRTSWIEHPD
ncbi:hypothetical protein [Pseudozobellia thermophila]|uniref:hypothetical protein n=1 Tax=Pseudozobellia thermophila TaxID=192903 RepID=UPI0009349EFD|nr:hypothetical protein [Pseudozobellia thermophila]